MFGKCLAKAFGIARKREPLVPNGDEWLSKRFAFMRYAEKMQPVTMHSYDRWNNRNALACLGHREQRVWRSTLDRNAWLDSCATAGCVERFANYETGIKQKQRMLREAPDVDRVTLTKLKRWPAGGHKFDRWQWIGREAPVIGSDRLKADAKVNLSAFQHGQLIEANGLDQLHLHFGIAFGVSGRKCRKNAFDHLRRSYYL
jgi:hypothetical protein